MTTDTEALRALVAAIKEKNRRVRGGDPSAYIEAGWLDVAHAANESLEALERMLAAPAKDETAVDAEAAAQELQKLFVECLVHNRTPTRDETATIIRRHATREGYVSVPRKATGSMCLQGELVPEGSGYMHRVWEAMLAAAEEKP